MKRLTPYVLPAVFGLLFVATALFVLAYALGYQIDLKHRRIEKTGLAYLTSFPANGFITVDNHYIKRKTPNKTNPLLPGKHTLRVQKNGYIPWTVQATIKPELATLYEHILLLPTHPKRIQLQSQDQVSKALVSLDGNHLIYTVSSGTDQGLWTSGLDLSSPKKLFPIAITNPTTTQAALAAYTRFSLDSFAADGSTALVVATKPNGQSSTLLVPLAAPATAVILDDVYKEFGNFTYQTGQSRRLYATKADSLYAIDTGTTAAPTLISDGVVAYSTRAGRVSYVKATSVGTGLYAANSDGGSPTLLLGKLTDGSYSLSDDPSSDAVALLSTADGQLRVISKNNAQQSQILIIGSGYSFVSWSRTDSRLLYGGQSGAFVYDMPDVVTTQVLSRAASSGMISWMYDAYHLIFIDAGKVMIAEDDGQNATQLGSSGTLPAYSNNSKDIYLILSDGRFQAQSTRDPEGA